MAVVNPARYAPNGWPDGPMIDLGEQVLMPGLI